MPKVRIKITGIECGAIKSDYIDVDVPDFEVKRGRRLVASNHTNVPLPDLTIREQQVDYIDKRYDELIVDHVENYLWPIMGYEICRPQKSRGDREKAKLKEILDALTNTPEFSVQGSADFVATLNRMWPVVKMLSVVQIADIIGAAMNVGYEVAIESLRKVIAFADKIEEDDKQAVLDYKKENIL